MPPRPTPSIRGIQSSYGQFQRCRRCEFSTNSSLGAESPSPAPRAPPPSPRRSAAPPTRKPSGLLSALGHKPIEGPFTSKLLDVNREAMEVERAEAKLKRKRKSTSTSTVKGTPGAQDTSKSAAGEGQGETHSEVPVGAQAHEVGLQVVGQGEGPGAGDKVTWTIPMLPHPLGVRNPPIASDTTWNQELVPEERRAARREALLKEASRGYFHDYNRIQKMHGGKLWLAPPVLIREDKALYFPNIAGRNLKGEKSNTTNIFKGRVSLVSIVSTRLSEEQVRTLVPPVLEDQEGKPGFAYVQINHQPNRLKSMLLSFFVSSLQRMVPSNRWSDYLLTHGEWTEYDVSPISRLNIYLPVPPTPRPPGHLPACPGANIANMRL
nr:Triosephosphate isomerase [Naematelia aurantialba]